MGITRKATLLLGVVGSLGLAGTAGAQIPFTGNSQGCFAATFTPGCSATFGGITFQGTGISFIAPLNGTTGVGNLGYFDLPGVFTPPAGWGPGSTQPFTLFVTLTNPNVNGAPPGNANGPISGTLTGTIGFGGGVTFAPSTFSFGFADPVTGAAGTGFFSFSTPTGIQQHGGFGTPFPNAITGTLVTTTPEPSSMALLGTGLVGLVPMFRRRRNS